MKILPEMEENSVDLVFFDPPYNVGKDYGDYKDSLTQAEYEYFMETVIDEARRVSYRGVVVYVGGKLARMYANLLPDAHMIVIEKRAAGVFGGNYMLQYHVLFSTAPPIIKCKDLWDDIRLPGEGYFFKEKRYDHPGQTAVALTNRVLHHFSLEGETICDPFAGVGSTGVSCVKMSRNFIGCEINPAYCAIAERRIKEEQMQIKMF
jgi:DNA modification methylase